MAGTDNSTVKITITVVDANSGAVISQTTKNLSSLGEAGKAAGDKVSAGAKKGAVALAEAGEAGAAAGKKIAAGMGEAGAHTLTNLDKVRLLRDDLGIRLPRAMENVIARSSAMSSAIGAMGSGLIALGAIEVFVRMGKQVYDLYEKFFDTTRMVDEFNQKLAESARQKFFDIAAIEDVNTHLKQTDQTMDALLKKQQNSVGIFSVLGTALKAGITGGTPLDAVAPVIKNRYFNKSDAEDLNARTADHDAGQSSLLEKNHQQVMREIEDYKLRAGALQGDAKAQAEHDAAMRTAMENRRYNNARLDQAADIQNRARKPGDPIAARDPKSGAQEMQGEIGSADITRAVASAELRRKNSDDLLKMQSEGHEAELRGEEKYRAAKDESARLLEQQERRHLMSWDELQAQKNALDAKYQAERLERLQKENAETARAQAEAAQGGLTGLARVDAGTNARITGIQKQAPDFSDPNTAAQREAAARQQGLQEQQRDQQQFTERLQQMDSGRAQYSESATQRIAEEAKRTIAEIEKAWQEMYGGLDAMDARRVQSRQAVNAAELQVQQQAARQEAEIRQGLVDQTIKAEEEGSRRGLTREQEARQAILDEYNERYRQLEELRAKDAANADLYRRQEIAAEESKDGKLIEQEREMRDKLAGTIRGFMDNPLQALKKQGEEMASKQLADLLLKANGGQAPGDSHTGLFGMSLPGRKHTTAPEPVHTTTSSVSAASTTLTAGTATIHIGSATFSDMPGSAGASVPAAAAVMASSSGAQGVNVGTAAYLAGGGGGSASTSSSSSGGGDYGMLGADNSSWSGDAGVQNPGQLALDPLNGGWTGSGQKISNDVTGTLDTLQSTTDSLNQAFGGGSSGSKSGSSGNAGASGSATNPTSSLISTVTPYASAGAGIYSAVESNGGLGGALQGGMAGMKLGSLVGGPIGAGIGLAAGAIIGFIGFGGAEKAAEYDRKQVRPRIENDIVQFGTGAMDYQSALQDLIQLDQEARKQTKQWGIGGKRQWDDHIHPEIMKAQQELTREQKAGRSQYSSSAAQFHGGGYVGGFRDFATSPTEGWLHAEIGETVMHQQATNEHGHELGMMLGGATREQMAAHYAPASTVPAASSSGPVNLHFHSPDAAGTYQLFMDNKHHIRKALNASYAENSGGSDLG